MGSRSSQNRAEKYSFSEADVEILYRVTAWFNGIKFRLHDKTISIATHHEPALRRLCEDKWTPEYESAHERLIDRGLLKSKARDEDVYIAGQRCRYLPTSKCMQVIEDVYRDCDDIYPDWILDEHVRPPTYRDGSELMEHRKGVLAADHLFRKLERVSSIDVYPRVNVAQRPDLWLYGYGDLLARAEVLTAHRNTQSWKSKFDAWRSAGPTIWIYENRENMVRFWNHLIDSGLIDLDGGRFGSRPSNWSPKRVNQRLRRSRQGAAPYNSVDVVWTIPGVLNGNRVDAFELFKDNRITFRS